jgi:hypothetical protein
MTILNSDFADILRTLAHHDVDAIVVGGICATLHGAIVNTLDVDIVHSRTPENLERLLAALTELEARYRDLAGRHIKPNLSYLASDGHQLLMTRSGPLDVLGTIGNGLGYEELVGHSSQILVAEGLHSRILNLDTLIEVKEKAGRDKDKAVLPILRRALEAKRKP